MPGRLPRPSCRQSCRSDARKSASRAQERRDQLLAKLRQGPGYGERRSSRQARCSACSRLRTPSERRRAIVPGTDGAVGVCERIRSCKGEPGRAAESQHDLEQNKPFKQERRTALETGCRVAGCWRFGGSDGGGSGSAAESDDGGRQPTNGHLEPALPPSKQARTDPALGRSHGQPLGPRLSRTDPALCSGRTNASRRTARRSCASPAPLQLPDRPMPTMMCVGAPPRPHQPLKG